MTSTTSEPITIFSQADRLDKLRPVTEQYAIDELLTEHFGFAPKVFTGHLFNIINEAIYDTVASVEQAVLESYFPGGENGPSNPDASVNDGYPSKDDIAKSLNQLETLLCSSIDNQFDLLEIWLHRNVFNFPSMRDELMKHFRFKHMNLWDHFYQTPQSDQQLTSEKVPPDWEKIKAEEEQLWIDLDKQKSAYNQSKDDYHSLKAVSNALDRKLAELKAVSDQLNQIRSESTIIYDPKTNKPIDLLTQSSMISGHYQRLVDLDRKQDQLKQKVNFKPQTSSISSIIADDFGEEEGLDLPTNPMTKYSLAINQLSKAKTDDFLAELAEKGATEIDKDEALVEVLNHASGKGKATVLHTPLHCNNL